MRRYGGTTADVVANQFTGEPMTDAVLTVWTDRNGSPITEIYDLDGNLYDGQLTTADNGAFTFQLDTDQHDFVWVQDQSSRWWRCPAWDIADRAAEFVGQFPQVRDDVASARQAAEQAEQSAAAMSDAADKAVDTADKAHAIMDGYKDQTPTLEDLLFSTVIPGDTIGSGGLTVTVFAAPKGITVGSITLVWDQFEIGADDDDYWTVDVLAGGESLGKWSTTDTGKQARGAIEKGSSWTLSGAPLDGTTLHTYDTLQLEFSRTGNPPDMQLPVTATIGYLPV